MTKIAPNLWFDSQAEEAARLYASLFKNSRIGRKTYYGKAGFEIHGQPEGKLMTIEFELEGQAFLGLNGGPAFKFTPAVSFLIACGTKEEVDGIWEKLVPRRDGSDGARRLPVQRTIRMDPGPLRTVLAGHGLR